MEESIIFVIGLILFAEGNKKQSMENIIKSIRQFYPVSDASLELLFRKMKRLDLPKKHLLIRGGVIDRHVYFIEKGVCRSYCLLDGQEITIWFSREGDVTFAMKDLYHRIAYCMLSV